MSANHLVGPVDVQMFDVHVTSSVPTNTINIGDFVFNASGKVRPAATFTWNTDLATTQTAFAAAFVGVSEDRSRAGVDDTRDLRLAVNMDGTYEVDADSATYTINQYVGMAKATGNALLSSKVAGVSGRTLAVGVVVENTTGTRVKIRLLNTTAKK